MLIHQTGKFYWQAVSTNYNLSLHASCVFCAQNLPIKLTKKIYFVYEKGDEFVGSVFLRAHQICYLINSQFPNSSKVITRDKLLNLEISDSILVFNKKSSLMLDSILSNRLRKFNNILISDLIDGNYLNFNPKYFDIAISISKENCEYLKNRIKFEYIPHFIDLRAFKFINSPKEKMVCYFGTNQKLNEVSSEMRNLVDFIEIPENFSIIGINNSFRDSAKYRFHLISNKAESRSNELRFRTNTKLLTCLVLGSIPLIDERDRQSLEFLGSDWPNLINSFDSQLSYLTGVLSNDPRIQKELCPLTHLNRWVTMFAHI